jgi:hypothetical protein
MRITMCFPKDIDAIWVLDMWNADQLKKLKEASSAIAIDSKEEPEI